jgi:hypothetical protein
MKAASERQFIRILHLVLSIPIRFLVLHEVNAEKE